ncbi:MAG: TCP-1/cpn60 chaperonin family protein, partial [Thermoplasmata archaeon]|nr:TCP-1/cpn60 chaperonin family protein [Thermoplasmata archaeon]
MMGGQTPIIVLKEGTKRERGKGAQYNNIEAALAISDAVRSTLGPKGMDKMLVDSMGDVTITNDGVTILKEVDVEHPAAKMIVEVAKTQDNECGDGTTTAVVLAGELLKKAEELLDSNVHPTVIANGYRMASVEAKKILNKNAIDLKNLKDKKLLKKIAMTSMASKTIGGMQFLADLAVNAVLSIVDDVGGRTVADIDNIQIVKKQGGSIRDTELIKGIIVDKEAAHTGMPKYLEVPKIALINQALEIKKTEVDAKIEIDDPFALKNFLDQEEATLKGMVNTLKETGANAIFCQKGIDDLAQHYLSKNGMFAIARVKKSDLEKLSKATGAEIVNNLKDMSKKDLGSAGVIEERKFGKDSLTFITGCKNPMAVSILIRGGTEHVVAEADRALHDALSVVSDVVVDGKYIVGGGASAMEIAQHLKSYASTVGGREQMAIDSYADSVEIVPKSLAENAGYDPINTIIDLRSAHSKKKRTAGINLKTGKVGDMLKLEVIEPLRVGTQAIDSATDVAIMILRIDDVIASRGMSQGEMAAMAQAAQGGGGMGGMG